MYGNFEYGSTPYGDSYTAIAVIIISKGSIDVIFISSKRVNLFAAYVKPLLFTAARKTNTFISQEQSGKRCGGR